MDKKIKLIDTHEKKVFEVNESEIVKVRLIEHVAIGLDVFTNRLQKILQQKISNVTESFINCFDNLLIDEIIEDSVKLKNVEKVRDYEFIYFSDANGRYIIENLDYNLDKDYDKDDFEEIDCEDFFKIYDAIDVKEGFYRRIGEDELEYFIESYNEPAFVYNDSAMNNKKLG